MRSVIGVYTNGNYNVAMLSDGTKIRSCKDGKMIPAFAESIDVKVTNKCDMNCKFCFVDGTMVSTNNGETAIEKISIGDNVIAFDDKSNTITNSTVTNMYKHWHTGEIIHITLENGKIINCTPNHKFYTTNRGWVSACDLKEDDDLYDKA